MTSDRLYRLIHLFTAQGRGLFVPRTYFTPQGKELFTCRSSAMCDLFNDPGWHALNRTPLCCVPQRLSEFAYRLNDWRWTVNGALVRSRIKGAAHGR